MRIEIFTAAIVLFAISAFHSFTQSDTAQISTGTPTVFDPNAVLTTILGTASPAKNKKKGSYSGGELRPLL